MSFIPPPPPIPMLLLPKSPNPPPRLSSSLSRPHLPPRQSSLSRLLPPHTSLLPLLSRSRSWPLFARFISCLLRAFFTSRRLFFRLCLPTRQILSTQSKSSNSTKPNPLFFPVLFHFICSTLSTPPNCEK